MNNNYINFRRHRELGEIISDTFKFLRENYKLLFKLIFQIAGPVFVLLILSLGYYYYLNGTNDIFSDGISNVKLGSMLGSVFLMLSSFLVFFVMLQGTVLHFIKSYVENNGLVNPLQVRNGVKTDFWRILGTTVMVGFLVFFGLVLCVIPGIYLWVPLSLAVPLVVFAQSNSLMAIEESFRLIKDKWWMTFISLFVMGLLMYIVALIFQMPLIIYMMVKMFTIVQEGSAADPGQLIDWVYIVFNIISSLIQNLLYTILIIGIAFIYYSLDEEKNSTGSLETISNLGSSENS